MDQSVEYGSGHLSVTIKMPATVRVPGTTCPAPRSAAHGTSFPHSRRGFSAASSYPRRAAAFARAGHPMRDLPAPRRATVQHDYGLGFGGQHRCADHPPTWDQHQVSSAGYGCRVGLDAGARVDYHQINADGLCGRPDGLQGAASHSTSSGASAVRDRHQPAANCYGSVSTSSTRRPVCAAMTAK